MDLLLLADASRFGIDEPVSELAVQQMLDRIAHDRRTGVAFTYVITVPSTRAIVGLLQTRQIDLSWKAPSGNARSRRRGAAPACFSKRRGLVGSFAFGTVGVHRLSARAAAERARERRASKLGAVQEGILRESMRRGNEYLDQVLWSVLKEDWGEHWVSTAPRVH